MESENRIYYRASGMPYVKSYLDEGQGRPLQDLWADIVMSKSGSERLGYPTQKPLALLERIINASSKKGYIVLDPFCGCATACVAADKLGRKWVGIDISPKAVELVNMRFQQTMGSLFHHGYETARTDIPRHADIEAPFPTARKSTSCSASRRASATAARATSRSSCSRSTTACPALAAAPTTWKTCNCSARATTASRATAPTSTWWQDWRRLGYREKDLKMFEINNKRDHYIPQFYLRGFRRQDKPKQIYLFDKIAPEKGIQSRAISKVEVSKDAFSVAFDKFMKEKESQWGDIFQRLNVTETTELNELIANRDDSASLRLWIAHFVIDIGLRSRGLREQHRESHSEAFHSLGMEMDEIIEQLDGCELVRETGATKEEIKKLVKQATHADNFGKWLAVTLRPSLTVGNEGMYNLISDGSWRFYRPLGPRRFITSDVPSTILRLGPEYPNWIWFEVPLTETLLLRGLCGDAALASGTLPRDEIMSDEVMDRINKMILEKSVRFVYSSSKEELRVAAEGIGE